MACTSSASACLPSSVGPEGVTPLEGQWEIAGQATSGSGGTLHGTLTVQNAANSGFTGAYDVLVTTGQGQQQRVSGPIAGRAASATAFEFDVNLGATTRRHVATSIADTLRGNWFDVGATGAVEASGSFRAVRR
ncbi:hypothetical protein [Gemmatimonas sp.]